MAYNAKNSKADDGPQSEDIIAVEQEHGPLPANASLEQRAHRYNLYVARMIIRQYRQQTASKH